MFSFIFTVILQLICNLFTHIFEWNEFQTTIFYRATTPDPEESGSQSRLHTGERQGVEQTVFSMH